jgi:hypothetical protein
MTKSNTKSNRDAAAIRSGQEKVLAAAPEIFDALIAQAIKGSYQHAKFLFDLLDFAPDESLAEDDIPGPSLAEILLDRLQLMQTDPRRAVPDTDRL